MQRTRVASFAELEQEFIERVHRMVWCNVATLDTQNRPRSRILHPIWEGATGWIGTRRKSPKAKHLTHNPHVSLAYIADIAKPVYADCVAEWADDRESKQRVWELFKAAPEPLGYDPGLIFGSMDNPDYGVLKLTPWRIEVASFPVESWIWYSEPESTGA
ncbi:MAG: pyridoxamine 5'-phosphate oxidase family protein [Anaerolineae bacterium]|nr:pyridoxamine 5'-phosphate oxidase family protein [Anaerolineae bacterium]